MPSTILVSLCETCRKEGKFKPPMKRSDIRLTKGPNECNFCGKVVNKASILPMTVIDHDEIYIPSETFKVYVRQAGIRCPKCGILLLTDEFFRKGRKVKCTNATPCDFEGEVEYPVGVNFV